MDDKTKVVVRSPDGVELEVSDMEFTINGRPVGTVEEIVSNVETGERTEVVDLDLVKVVENNIAVCGATTLNAIRGAFTQAFFELTGPARRAKAPHQYRSDLLGNGMPRKRGKGKY